MRSAGRAGRAAAISTLVVLMGCEAVEERYGARAITAPEPLGGGAVSLAAGPPIKPSGVVPVTGEAARALRGAEVYPGRREGGAPDAGVPAPPDPGGEPVDLNFVQTPISEVVDVVLGQILGESYAIDERVEGTITTRSARPIPRGELRAVLENLLAVNGAAIVDDGTVARIVPISVARQTPRVVVPPGSRPLGRGFGTYFIPLRRADVGPVAEALAGQIGADSQLVADPPRNMLIYTGPQQEALAVERMAETLDVDLLSGRSFALIPLGMASPATVAEEVSTLLGGDEGAVVPIERMNAVLAIANSPAQLRELGAWIARLDRADSAASQQLFVYYVRTGLATELADTLNATFGTGAQPRAAERPGELAPGLEPFEAGLLDAPTGLGAAEPGAVVDAFGEAPVRGFDDGGGFAGDGDGPRIVADPRRNAIVVRGSGADLRDVRETLQRLDTQPIQILIEATIAEVVLNDRLEYGLRWAFETGDFSAILTDSAAGTVGPSFPGLNLVVDTADALAVLRALSEVTDVQVISSPQLMVVENETARLQVGDQVPILTQEVLPITDVDAPVRNQVSYIDTGVILEVTPSVNADGLVSMQVRQEVSDAIRNQSSDINSPTIQQRRVNSTVAVRSGQTVALGGLIRERREEGESGVPVLMDVPVVGNLFKTTTRSGTRTELLVLITPRVVRDSLEAQSVTDELRGRLSRLADIL